MTIISSTSLTPCRWRCLEALLDDMLDRPQVEQEACLARVRAEDLTLYKQLLAILDGDAEGLSLSTRSVHRYAANLFSDNYTTPGPSDYTGYRIGPYRVVRELYRGSMSIVCLAERTDGAFEQCVAVKIANTAAHGRNTLRRFMQERQLLAKLNHPNIVTLLDGGTTQDDLPYFVMEYVEGVAIDEFCNQRRLSIDDRLHLFLELASAMQHVHDKNIIHRDIKPSNVLVDSSGQLKLLDFGIAKVHSPDVSARYSVTRTGVVVLTPQYATPEQLGEEPVTARSDIYQMGLLLYEILAGQRPFDNQYQNGLAGIGQPRELLLPSLAVHSDCEADCHARERNTTPRGLHRKLKGDLDGIVRKALENTPESRYPSVEKLGGDIQGYLRRAAVESRDLEYRYKAAGVLDRSGMAIAASSVLATFLLVALGATGWQAHQTRVQRECVEQLSHRVERLASLIIDDVAQLKRAGASHERLQLEVRSEISADESLSKHASGDTLVLSELQ